MDLPFTDTLYRELRTLAAGYLRREPPGSTLQPTALVHEAFLRLQASAAAQGIDDRVQFFGLAARELRRLLVQHARRRRTRKRGGDWRRITLVEAEPKAPSAGVDLLALDDALQALAESNPSWVRVVELRYFAGLNEIEVANLLDVDVRTVRRRWVAARAWLRRALEGPVTP